MDRRKFVAIASSAFAAPKLLAQSSKVWRIGYLASSPPRANEHALAAFRAGMRELGYAEGRNLVIEYRWTDDDVAGLPSLAKELVASKVDLILAWTTPVVIAARAATSTVPIVMVGIADPVGSGLVKSLGRPGGNITGVSNLSAELSQKLVELVAQIVPGIKVLAGIRNSLNVSSALQQKETEAAAKALGLQFHRFDIRSAGDLDAVFREMSRVPADAAVFFADPLWVSQRERIAELARAHRMPTAFARVENVEAGGLMAYGSNLTAQFRRTAALADRIFKGTNPAEIPVEQPTTLELAVNLKTAKALGLTVSQSVLLRADRVIE